MCDYSCLFVYNLSIVSHEGFMQSRCINLCQLSPGTWSPGRFNSNLLSASSWNNVSVFIPMQLTEGWKYWRLFFFSLCLKLMFWLAHPADLINTNRRKKKKGKKKTSTDLLPGLVKIQINMAVKSWFILCHVQCPPLYNVLFNHEEAFRFLQHWLRSQNDTWVLPPSM